MYDYGYPLRHGNTFAMHKILQMSSASLIYYCFVAEMIDEMNVINFKYICIIFIMGKTDCAINGMCDS